MGGDLLPAAWFQLGLQWCTCSKQSNQNQWPDFMSRSNACLPALTCELIAGDFITFVAFCWERIGINPEPKGRPTGNPGGGKSPKGGENRHETRIPSRAASQVVTVVLVPSETKHSLVSTVAIGYGGQHHARWRSKVSESIFFPLKNTSTFITNKKKCFRVHFHVFLFVLALNVTLLSHVFLLRVACFQTFS